jgi:hypothetical protein
VNPALYPVCAFAAVWLALFLHRWFLILAVLFALAGVVSFLRWAFS